jgi:alginate O-acetyltransferase complex protein AlgI
VYRGHLKPAKNLGQYLAFVAMFPQLVAGPIVRAVDMLPALSKTPKMSPEGRWSGFQLMVHGYFKKMVIADNLAPIVDGAFASSAASHSSGFWWCIVVMFAFQIYCDFSGYSDIARGLGEWMGYRFPVNFNHPYTAVGFRDFWSRWHMSLSTWFRDYVYFPLGGNRRGAVRTHVNLWITMLISGFWHGASWTFILWGAVHAALLSVEQLTNWAERIRSAGWFGRVVGAGITFVAVCFTWVIFRSDSLTQATGILYAMCTPSLSEGIDLISQFGVLPIVIVVMIVLRESYFLTGMNRLPVMISDKFNYAKSLSLATAIVVTIFLRGPGQSFVYFQF